MNWRNDSRIKKLLEKSTLETLLKVYFQRVHGKEEVQQMENVLKNALEKYSKKELIYEKLYDENNEIEAEPLMNECLDALCDEPLNRAKDHTPQTLLMLVQLFIRIGDYRLACEIIWCSAAISIQDFIRLRGLKVLLHSHDSKRLFVQSLSHEEIRKNFTALE
uniref:Uncharacterized protein n=1 Tax=Acrobeloides nanus TaxID=290746 RepID=A0A914BYA0_9BILA